MEHIVTQSRCISINFPRVYLFALAAYSRASMPHYDLRGDLPGVWGKWQRGLLNLINLGSILGENTSGFPIFVEFRCILFWDTSESDIIVESRCIWNLWFLEHTSEMPDVGPFRCIVTIVSVGDTSGLRFQCPSRCTGVPIYLPNTSGWTNIG